MRPLDEYPHCEPDRCGACGADIVWVQTINGNAVAVDPLPVDGGELVIITGLIQPPLDGLTEAIFGQSARYKSHLRTCSDLNDELKQRSHERAMSKAAHPHEITNCNCGARMFFAPSAKGNGKKLPLCELPSPVGNVFLNDRHEGVHVSAANPAPPGALLYMSHFVDCPNKEQFRTKK